MGNAKRPDHDPNLINKHPGSISKPIAEAQKLDPSALIELFILDGNSQGYPVTLRYTNNINTLGLPIVFQGQTYLPTAIQAKGFEFRVKGELPHPSLDIANPGSFISALCAAYNDFVGWTVTRKRTFTRFLDVQINGKNNPFADAQAEWPEDIYYVDRKSAESKESVSFELGTAIDVNGIQLPLRIVAPNICAFMYRSPECSFAANDVIAGPDDQPLLLSDGSTLSVNNWRGLYDSSQTYNFGDGVYTVSPNSNVRLVYIMTNFSSITGISPANSNFWFLDQCSRTLVGCKLRFDPPIPVQGLPHNYLIGTGTPSNFSVGEKVTIGGDKKATAYTFVSVAGSSPAFQVALGATLLESLTNLSRAINAASQVGLMTLWYSSDTTANINISASIGAGGDMIVTNLTGLHHPGNSPIPCTTSSAAAKWLYSLTTQAGASNGLGLPLPYGGFPGASTLPQLSPGITPSSS